jgi:tRNA G18 (ribose-2'-O)-methylase SpoU
VAVDNVPGSQSLSEADLPANAVLVFGSEGDGLSEVLLAGAHHIVAIEQFGSTRSLNVGVAAGVVMYEWVRRQVLTK